MASSPSTSRILEFPPELILMIIESADSLSGLAAMIRTAKIFNNVWISRTTLISAAVVPRNIECYLQALSLEDSLHPEPPATYEMALQRHNRILKAAKCASHAWALFCLEYTARKFGRQRPYPTNPNDRRRFKQMFYWMWKLVGASSFNPLELPRNLKENLDQLPREYIIPLCEMTIWIAGSYPSNPRPRLMICSLRRVYAPRDGFHCSYLDRWVKCCRQLWLSESFTKCHNDHFERDLHVRRLPQPFRGMFHHGQSYEVRERLESARKSREFFRKYWWG